MLVRDSENLEEKGLFAEYLAQKTWYAYDVFYQSKPQFEGLPPSPLQVEAEESLKITLETVQPVLQELLIDLSQSQNGKNSIRRVFEYLQSAEQKELSDQLILNEGMTNDERLVIVVQYINTYGFIPAIETLSPYANSKPEIKTLYNRLQGDHVADVMENLWQVYKKYEQEADFAQYYGDEITKRDVSIIERWSAEVEDRFGKNRDELNVVSLAAGKGRIAFAMANIGFNVVAVEPQKAYVNAIKTNFPSDKIHVVQKEWGNLAIEDLGYTITKKDLEAEFADENYIKGIGGLEKAIKIIGERKLRGVELGESTGRNLPHGNSPQRLLETFDAIRTISKDNAIWVIDFMDPNFGTYEENVQDLKKNLIELGVDPFQANFTFEGPTPNLKFNRMTVSREQMDAYAELLGFKVQEVIEDIVGEGVDSFKNVYYVLEVDKDYYPQKISQERLQELMMTTGLIDPGVDLNAKIKSWDLSLGQALVFGFPDTREYKNSLAPNVRFIRNGAGNLRVEGSRRGY